MLDVYPAREEPVGELAGVSGLQVAEAAAERDGGQAGLVAADRGGRRARRWPPGSGPATSWSRSAPATSSSSARRWSGTRGQRKGDG